MVRNCQLCIVFSKKRNHHYIHPIHVQWFLAFVQWGNYALRFCNAIPKSDWTECFRLFLSFLELLRVNPGAVLIPPIPKVSCVTLFLLVAVPIIKESALISSGRHTRLSAIFNVLLSLWIRLICLIQAPVVPSTFRRNVSFSQ